MRLAARATLGDGRYRLERRLGAGGMASVWLAHDELLDRRVALKVISDALAADPGYLARFEREARAAAALSHRNVVRVFDYGVDDDRPYLVLEYVRGPSLADWLAREPRPPLDSDMLARGLLDALAHIHEAGILHRDIKPGNVLLAPDRTPKVTDFGIAKTDDTTALTRTGQVVGTLKYLAPEVTEGASATVASDLHSLGVLLRQVAGTRPPTHAGGLIDALTAREPEHRPSSARAALSQFGGKEPTVPSARGSEPAAAASTQVLPAPSRVITIGRRGQRRRACAAGRAPRARARAGPPGPRGRAARRAAQGTRAGGRPRRRPASLSHQRQRPAISAERSVPAGHEAGRVAASRLRLARPCAPLSKRPPRHSGLLRGAGGFRCECEYRPGQERLAQGESKGGGGRSARRPAAAVCAARAKDAGASAGRGRPRSGRPPCARSRRSGSSASRSPAGPPCRHRRAARSRSRRRGRRRRAGSA